LISGHQEAYSPVSLIFRIRSLMLLSAAVAGTQSFIMLLADEDQKYKMLIVTDL
jgi:hypothetical protein